MIPWEGASRPPRAWQAAAYPIVKEAMCRREAAIVSAIMGSGKSILQAELCAGAIEKLGERAIVLSAPRKALVRQLSATISERCGEDAVGVYYSDKKQPARRIIVTCGPSLGSLRTELAARQRRVALLIADEAHGSEAESVREAIEGINPVCLLGFTATPFRSIPKETISVFKSVVFRYTLEDALRDGVLVPLRHVRYEGTLEPESVDEECRRMIMEHGDGPGIVSALSIRDADEYAGWLTENGVSAESIHSGHSQTERDERLARLQSGEIRCLVHVSLLAEGVDLPWLRWLCLRRPVGARVRFLQEVGRVLRTHPGKREGVVLDPHLLLGRHGLTTVEAIGAALQAAADAECAEEGAKKGPGKELSVVALDMLLAYLAELRAELEDRGVVKPRTIAPGGWMLAGASQRQVEVLADAKRLTRHIPGDYREPIKALIKVPWALTRGQMSDLLDVLYGGEKWAGRRSQQTGEKFYRIQWPRSLAGSVAVPDWGADGGADA